MKPAIGKQPEKLYTISDVQNIANVRDSVLIAHAMTGSDTTSCIYRRSKTKALKFLCKPEFEDIRRTFLTLHLHQKLSLKKAAST